MISEIDARMAVINDFNCMKAERDEARRWARHFMYRRDNWHANYNLAKRLLDECKAENAALRRELEELRILIAAKQQELDARPVVHIFSSSGPEYRTYSSGTTGLLSDETDQSCMGNG